MENNQEEVYEGQTTWAELRECEKMWYMAFWAPVVNNVRQVPNNNDICQIGWNWAPPTDLQLGTVIDRGDELVRTTNWRPNEEQRNAMIFWLEENPENPSYN